MVGLLRLELMSSLDPDALAALLARFFQDRTEGAARDLVLAAQSDPRGVDAALVHQAEWAEKSALEVFFR